ncbi:hypothetical protein HDU91_007443 [Kappamyces sp. JEL0680]|nr:hypothetical protein HDU91_007443 [Kappamyces sp. JEL0680]
MFERTQTTDKNHDLKTAFKKVLAQSAFLVADLDEKNSVPNPGFNSSTSTNLEFLLASTLAATLESRLKRRKRDHSDRVEELIRTLQDEWLEEKDAGQEEIKRLLKEFASLSKDSPQAASQDQSVAQEAGDEARPPAFVFKGDEDIFAFEESSPVEPLSRQPEHDLEIVDLDASDGHSEGPPRDQMLYGSSLPISVPQMGRPLDKSTPAPDILELDDLAVASLSLTKDQLQSRSLMAGQSLREHNSLANPDATQEDDQFEPPHLFSARTFQDTSSLIGRPPGSSIRKPSLL